MPLLVELVLLVLVSSCTPQLSESLLVEVRNNGTLTIGSDLTERTERYTYQSIHGDFEVTAQLSWLRPMSDTPGVVCGVTDDELAAGREGPREEG